MKNLEKEYEVNRFDIKTSEKKILKKYTDTIKIHGELDIRINESNSDELLTINEYSLQKIFSLIEEYPEEHVLFLYLSEYKNQNTKQNEKSVNIHTIDSIDSSNQLNSSDIRLDTFDIESPPNQEIIKDNKNPQYICIFSILYFIIAGLLIIHLLQFLFSKEVRKYKFIIIFIL